MDYSKLSRVSDSINRRQVRDSELLESIKTLVDNGKTPKVIVEKFCEHFPDKCEDFIKFLVEEGIAITTKEELHEALKNDEQAADILKELSWFFDDNKFEVTEFVEKLKDSTEANKPTVKGKVFRRHLGDDSKKHHTFTKEHVCDSVVEIENHDALTEFVNGLPREEEGKWECKYKDHTITFESECEVKPTEDSYGRFFWEIKIDDEPRSNGWDELNDFGDAAYIEDLIEEYDEEKK